MQISSVILIGGESSRVGYPKHKLKYQGQTFLARIEASLAPLPIKYSVHSLDPNLQAGSQIIDDNCRIGPIGGIYRSLNASTTDYTLITSCDLPLLTNKLITYLIGKCALSNKSVIASLDGFPMPTLAIYKTSDKRHFKQAIDNGDYKLQNIINKLDCQLVEIPVEFKHELTNVNTLPDLQQLDPFIFTVSGFKNSGKTTLISKLITRYLADGLDVSVLKHDGHDFTVDDSTDTGKFACLGARSVTVYSSLKHQTTTRAALNIEKWLKTCTTPIIIIEGMKASAYPKIVIEDEQPIEASNRITTINKQTRNDVEAIYSALRKVQDDRYK